MNYIIKKNLKKNNDVLKNDKDNSTRTLSLIKSLKKKINSETL